MAKKQARPLYVSFTMEEIMEFFDWGIVFPNAYLPLLLTANDYKSRFQVEKTSFILSLSEQLSEAHNYYLEFDGNELSTFIEKKEGVEFSPYPIPTHFIKRIVCDSPKSKIEFERIWHMTDNDEIEIIIQPFEKVDDQFPSIDMPQEKIDQVISFIHHFDKCLGAICFTKDLDPIIKTSFRREGGIEEFSDLTYSRHFILLVREWMPAKSRKILDGLLSPISDNEERYIQFIEKMVKKNWDDDLSGAYLKALSAPNDPVDKIITAITSLSPAMEKIPKVLREIDLGISSLETALEDESLKNPYHLFLILLKLFYRKGRLETDARSFRQNLFEKDYITNPRHVSILGTLYGYYTGYHHFQRFESIKELDHLDISSDKEIMNIFRIRLSLLEHFDKEIINLIYSKVSAAYAGFPKPKPSFKKQKGKNKAITRDHLTFTPIPQLGQFAYQLTGNS